MTTNSYIAYAGSKRSIGLSTRWTNTEIAKNSYGYIYDEFTPFLMELEVWLGEVAARQVAEGVKKILPQRIKSKYKSRNNHTWKKNTPGWLAYKRRYGYSTKTMHMHDTKPHEAHNMVPLATTVEQVGDKLHVHGGDGKFVVTGLSEEFEKNPYVWFHETGYRLVVDGRHSDYGGKGMAVGRVPARPFIAPALEETMSYAANVLGIKNPATRREGIGRIRNPAMIYSIGEPYSMFDYEYEARRNMIDILSFLWWFMPQAEELKYLGYGHDIAGYTSGHFLSFDTFKNFARMATMGKIGQSTGMPVTRKLARRTSRRAIWGTQTVSVIGGR